jgi:lysozyme
MKFVDNWRRVVALSLSFWMQVAGLLVLILPEIYFYLTDRDYDPYLAWTAGVLLLLAGLIGRLFRQSDSVAREWLRILAVVILAMGVAFAMATRANAGSYDEAETLKIAVPFIAQEEGKRNKAYKDIVGVWTICYGSTRVSAQA